MAPMDAKIAFPKNTNLSQSREYLEDAVHRAIALDTKLTKLSNSLSSVSLLSESKEDASATRKSSGLVDSISLSVHELHTTLNSITKHINRIDAVIFGEAVESEDVTYDRVS